MNKMPSQEFQKNGFATTTVEKLINWAHSGSMWPIHLVWPVALLYNAPLKSDQKKIFFS